MRRAARPSPSPKERADSGRLVRPGDRARESRDEETTPARVVVRKAYKMYIGGAFVRSESGRCEQVTGAFDASQRESIPVASRKDVRNAVSAALLAFGDWSNRSAFNRGQVLYRLAEMLEGRHAELTGSLNRGGASLAEAAEEVNCAIDRTIAYAGWADKYASLLGSYNPTAGPHFNVTLPQPMGVVGLVTPARPALLGALGALLPIIASGNTCVILLGSSDQRTPLLIGEACATSDLPAGVVNLLSGNAPESLSVLARHGDVAALDLHGLDPAALCRAQQDSATHVQRVFTRDLDMAAWADHAVTSAPAWIERFVELKTIWHSVGV